MMSPDECSYCFCIHGQRQCVAPKCLLPVQGCRPRYRTFSCCPSFYDCREYGREGRERREGNVKYEDKVEEERGRNKR